MGPNKLILNSVKSRSSNITIRLKTLKLSDNNVTLADGAFNGLEQSLKNLNLKGCQLKSVPKALANLAGLAFLDLAQNSIRDLGSGELSGLSSLTALNLERNVIQKLSPSVFYGINDTVSSLSLLNNLLTSYPTQAITSLAELRVRTTVLYHITCSYTILVRHLNSSISI